MAVRFPEQALDPAGTDIQPPLRELQQGLSILPMDGDQAKSGASATFTGPPDSVAIIEAGATALSKWWSVVIAGLGGTAVITSAATKFWSGQSGAVRVGLIGGMAALLVAAIIAISIIVAADVRGRAQGSVALYAARASIANQWLRQSLCASRPVLPVAPANPPPVVVPAVQNAQNEAMTHIVAIYLAASGARALVLHKPTNQEAHLAGLRQLDDGTTELRLVRQVDQQTDWCVPGEITILEFSYP